MRSLHIHAESVSASEKRAQNEKPDVARRLRSLRAQLGLSQRELASRAGVTNGMISLIEQNKHSPSVATLNKITDALGMSFAEFFALDMPTVPRVFYSGDELTRLTEGKLAFDVVAGERRDKAIQILHEVYEPGGDTGPEMLTHPGEEGGIIIEGMIELTVGDQVRVLHKGEAYYFDSMVPHRFRNTGSDRVVLISACVPPSL